MFAGATVCLVILTGVVVFRARDAFYYGDRGTFWRRTALALPLAAMSCAAVWLLLREPELSRFKTPNPLGPNWDCETYGRAGATVCFKQPTRGG